MSYDIAWIASARHLHLYRFVERLIPPGMGLRFQYLDHDSAHEVAASVVVFGDLERLNREQRRNLRALETRLLQDGHHLLNSPRRSLTRYALLRRLHRAGVNRFTAHRLRHGTAGWCWPVFLREASEHHGVRLPLIASEQDLHDAWNALPERVDRSDVIAVEFADVASPDGLYRKYSALKVGPSLFPVHIVFSDRWHGKVDTCDGAALIAEELDYVRAFPHREAVARVFDMARIDYGRIDYAVRDDRIVVWEINTHPTPADRSDEDLRRLEAGRLYMSRLGQAVLSLCRRVALAA